MKSVFYSLIICCTIVSSATAASLNKPTPLSLAQMDSVTAGTTTNITVGAAASSNLFAYTATSGTAIATQTKTDNPLLGSYIGVAGGNATAIAVGGGASTGTSVTPTVDVPGTNTQTYEVDIHNSVGGIEINSASIIKIGSFINPLPLP
ncbi:MAG: hypothetical protein ACU4EQ_10575 [Candidatus Nitrosoglobus sp.]|jgi:hypothetical protein